MIRLRINNCNNNSNNNNDNNNNNNNNNKKIPNKITKGKYSKKESKVNIKLKKNIQMEISVF